MEQYKVLIAGIFEGNFEGIFEGMLREFFTFEGGIGDQEPITNQNLTATNQNAVFLSGILEETKYAPNASANLYFTDTIEETVI